MSHHRGYSQPGWARVLEDYCLSPLQSEERGQDLLHQWLSPEQAEQYDKCQRFEVVGCDTGTRYRILRGKIMNIVELASDGRVTRRWCFAPEGALVTGDVMLAQKIAHKSPASAPPGPMPPGPFGRSAAPPVSSERRIFRGCSMPPAKPRPRTGGVIYMKQTEEGGRRRYFFPCSSACAFTASSECVLA